MFGTIPIPPKSRLSCGRCLWLYGVALSSALWLASCAVRCQLAAVLVPLWPCRRLCPAPAVRSRGSPAAASPCVALRQSLRESRESRWHSRSPLCESRCESRKRLRQSRSFYPKIIVVYKIPCIKAGFSLPAFP